MPRYPALQATAPQVVDLDYALRHQDPRGRAQIEERVPHRGEMLLLDSVLWAAEGFDRGVGVKHVCRDEFWSQGHFPGAPTMPAVLMIEAGAQLACYLHNSRGGTPHKAAFIRIDQASFRRLVRPGDDLYLLCAEVRSTPRRFVCAVQGVVNRRVVFESRLAGVVLDKS